MHMCPLHPSPIVATCNTRCAMPESVVRCASSASSGSLHTFNTSTSICKRHDHARNHPIATNTVPMRDNSRRPCCGYFKARHFTRKCEIQLQTQTRVPKRHPGHYNNTGAVTYQRTLRASMAKSSKDTAR